MPMCVVFFKLASDQVSDRSYPQNQNTGGNSKTRKQENMNAPRIILDRTFECGLDGFDYKSIVCEIMDTKYGPIAFTMHDVRLQHKCAYSIGEEVEMTEGEISDAQKILDRIRLK